MAVFCDLEVDVNGEETFFLDKKLVLGDRQQNFSFLSAKVICTYSGRLSKLFGKSTCRKRNVKVIFHDFPGGPECFELMSKFCYNGGQIDINPSSISLLHSAALFMEMTKSVSGSDNLMEQTEKSIEEISYWTWPELLGALKHHQDPHTASNSFTVLEKCLDSLIGRLAVTNEASPSASTSSPDSSGFRFSSDTKSTESLRNGLHRSTWWFEDLSGLSLNLMEMLIERMVSRKFDHVVISRFLFYYQKSKCYSGRGDEKCKVAESVIQMLYTLDRNSISCKSLFVILRVAVSLKISKSSRNKLEAMIGSMMDQATLDNLLVPSPCGTSYLYDVNLVLRFLKAFLQGGSGKVSPMRLRKVAILIDLYIAEVAPDPSLKPSKFLALVMALPDYVRDSSDELYRAMDIYVEVHAGMSEEERIRICCALNYEKLSPAASVHVAQNAKFPSRTAVQALISQQLKLKTFIQSSQSKAYKDSPCSFTQIRGKAMKDEASEQTLVPIGKLELSTDNDKLKAHLQGMQWRVMELEKACQKMQTQMTKMMKSRVPSHARSLPRLCS